MHTINFISKSVFSKLVFTKSVLASSLLLISAFAMAQDDHSQHDMHSMDSTDSSSAEMMEMSEMDHTQISHMPMNHSQMNHASMDHSKMNHDVSSEVVDHSQHQAPKQAIVETQSQSHEQHQHSVVSPSNDYPQKANDQVTNHQTTNHQGHDHRTEHGAQLYAISTFDNKWLLDKEGKGALKSELETRIGTDENKLFIKIHADKHESHDAEFDAKVLYSRMISDFWDAQVGVRYRSEKVQLDQHAKDTEEKLDAVIGLHGMAQYFFETDAYFYAGKDNYSALSLETERDLLLTQKLIFKPYLDLDVVLSDDSKYAKKSGLSNATVGIETRYEMSKKIMPYLDIAYKYSKGNAETHWQAESDAEKGWLYGAGIRFKY